MAILFLYLGAIMQHLEFMKSSSKILGFLIFISAIWGSVYFNDLLLLKEGWVIASLLIATKTVAGNIAGTTSQILKGKK